MAKSFTKQEEKGILKNIKAGKILVKNSRLLIEDTNGEILTALEIMATSKKVLESKKARNSSR
jgi:hypothetical protein